MSMLIFSLLSQLRHKKKKKKKQVNSVPIQQRELGEQFASLHKKTMIAGNKDHS